MRARALLAGAAAAVAVLAVSPVVASPATRIYEVTITNLTSTQPLTPPVVATHSGGYDAFEVGMPAREGVQQIAENGDGGPLLDELEASKHVFDFLQTTTGPLAPDDTPGGASFDDSVTFEITGNARAMFISYVSMLICTNDGFTGTDGARLPGAVGETATYSSFGYDAGTEINTEDLADIVPPCQPLSGVADDEGSTGSEMTDPALAEGGVIHHHDGIQEIADLTEEAHGWDASEPVAELTVTRTA